MQLPPSLSFDPSVARAFLSLVRSLYDGFVVCEPRHVSWFSPAVGALFHHYRISRAAADPPPVPAAAIVGGWPRVAYFRLHGSPHVYWSRYDANSIATLARTLPMLVAANEVWFIFDNTAAGAAIENAWELLECLSRESLAE